MCVCVCGVLLLLVAFSSFFFLGGGGSCLCFEFVFFGGLNVFACCFGVSVSLFFLGGILFCFVFVGRVASFWWLSSWFEALLTFYWVTLKTGGADFGVSGGVPFGFPFKGYTTDDSHLFTGVPARGIPTKDNNY